MTRSILDDAILAKAASRILARLDSNVKNEVLQLMAAGLEQCSEGLLGVVVEVVVKILRKAPVKQRRRIRRRPVSPCV